MKFNFRKISALGSSLLLAGMSIATPIAASAYPAPFVEAGSANVAIVYGTGTGVSALDVVESGNIQSNLQSKMGTGVGTTSTAAGEAKSLASGSDLLYLLDDLAENVATITKDDLPTILADGTFVDDDGGSWEYEQTITMGPSTTNRFSFGNSNNDFDDPKLMLELSTATGTPMYTWTLSFDKATNLTATASESQEIIMFGKTYVISTATDHDTLVLSGGSAAQKVLVGETVTMTVKDVDYTVTLDGLSTATTTVASITINGDAKKFTEGQTKTYVIDGVDLVVNAKTVFRTGDSGEGHVEVILDSDQITLETGDAVSYGSDNTDIDTTLVTFTPASSGCNAMTKITIAVAAEDNDANHILVGEAFTDPVFGTLKLELTGVLNGPVFTAEKDTGRTLLELKTGGSRELQVVMTDSAGVTKTIPFTYDDIMQDDSRNPFVTVEGNNLTDDDYFFLNSGDYQHLMRVTKMNIATDTTSDVEIMDVFTGTKYLVENKDFNDGQNVTINSQSYTIMNETEGGSAAGINITRAGANAIDKRALFPYMELVAGEDFPRVAFINTTNLINDATGDVITIGATGALVEGRTYELPTGTVQFRVGNYTANIYADIGITPAGSSTETWTNVSGVNKTYSGAGEYGTGGLLSAKVGEAYYIMGYDSNWTGAEGVNKVTIKNITVDYGFDVDTTDSLFSPAIMFVEDKDKAAGENRSVILINTTDSGSGGYSEMSGEVLFSDTTQWDTESWDDTKLKGYLTSYGTYALRDQTDTNIHLASLSYGSAQMYADVYMAEVGASITAGTTAGGASQIGNILVKDSEVSSVATKNLIVVGGSCINSAAASLVGGSHCGAAWTTATNVGTGEFLIKGYSDSTITSKLALLVAGYNVADTVNAATYLRTQALDTSKEYKGTSSTSATLVTTETA